MHLYQSPFINKSAIDLLWSSPFVHYFSINEFVLDLFGPYAIVALWLGHWIPNTVIRGSKSLVGPKFDSAFHPSEIGQLCTRKSWGLSGKE